jgi:hypothetical protein
MFLTLAGILPNGVQSVFRTHPVQLSYWLDEVWALSRRMPQIPGISTGQAPGTRSALVFIDPTVVAALDLPTQPSPPFLAPSGLNVGGEFEWSGEPGPVEFDCPPRFWHHLVYAYLLESTGIVEVFAEVLRRLVVGETLGVLSADSIAWARSTEQLFFRDPPPFAINGVVSEVRPFERTNRRNAYWRMFGMDVAHPVPPHWPGSGALGDWKAHTGPGVNADFRQKWNELLRQVWLGVENRDNSSGSNPADSSYIALLCVALKEMMANRRRGGALAREELAYVSMLGWFHLAVDSDNSLVTDLQAQASSPGDRLAAIAQRVGMTPAARSRELFDLAEPMSTILRAIELGLFDTPAAATALFETGSTAATDMVGIINNWQSATGERVKERPAGTAVVPVAQPLRVPAPGRATPVTPASGGVAVPVAAPTGAPSSNGSSG